MRIPLIIAPGLDSDDTRTAAKGAYIDADKIRFHEGKAQTKGGFARMLTTPLTGVCRNLLSFSDLGGQLNTAFGTHSNLQLALTGGLHDITPTLGAAAVILSANPLSATASSAVVTVNHPAHGYTTGMSIAVSGAGQVGGTVPNGTFSLTVVDANTYTYTFGSAAAATTLSANPLAVTVASAVVTVHQVAHGLSNGATVTIAGATALGGITPNGTFSISVVDADHFTFLFTATSSAATAGGGSAVTVFASPAGGAAVQIQPQTAFAAGNIDGVGGAGFGTGAFGSGLYGAASTGIAYARTWSLSAYGGSLMASPRGGPIYWWQNNLAVPAAPLANAPAQVTYMMVAPNRRQVMAFGCTGVDGVFNPSMIRWSGLQQPTTWSPPDGTVAGASSTAGLNQLEGGGGIVAARAIGDSILVWTKGGLYRGDYTGDVSQLWVFSKIADHCGLIGPNAAVVVSQIAYWLSPGGQFWVYGLGGVPTPLPCPILKAFTDNLAVVQQDKIVASSISAGFGQVRFDYPDGRDGFENSRFLLLDTGTGKWSRGIEARSAAADTDPAPYPIAASPSGNVFYQENGTTADGGPISYALETADLVLSADPVMVREFWPDFQSQVGALSVTFLCRDHSQGAEKTYGPFVCQPGQSRIQLRITTRIMRLRITSNVGPTFWRMGEPYLEATPAGNLGRR